MLEGLKQEVYKANLALVDYELVIFTWGNVSAIDRDKGLVVIKPSGVSYETMKPEDMVVVDLDGNIVEGSLRPSSDTPTHLELYKAFEGVEGIVHTHSPWAVSWAQAGRSIPCLGTTHADYFYGDILCTSPLPQEMIETDYEKNTGLHIIEAFRASQKDPLASPGVLVNQHGPFTWGKDAKEAVYHAKVLEEVAKMAYHTVNLRDGNFESVPQGLMDKHYFRKHGANAYYGQKG